MGSYWESCLSVGGIGENYVVEYLVATGATVYTPPANESHPIDFMVVDADMSVWACDVKTTPRRMYYADNTIDAGDYVKYAQIASKMPVRVFFVDYFEGCAYSCPIPGSYARDGVKMRIPLSACKFEFRLSEDQASLLAGIACSGYTYAGVTPYFLTP